MPPPSTFTAMVRPAGLQFEAASALPLLASARQAGIELPASCRNGTCRTCICRMTRGRVHYRIEWPGLTREEKAEGFILPCVAYPDSDVDLEVPAARRLPKQE